jgi:lipopolysaccharide biosynthesis glycosyltransferase
VSRAIRKWYFATNINGIRHAYDQIQSALLSCNANTSLQPHCIIDSDGATPDDESRILWLEENGAKIIRHRADLLRLLRPVFGSTMDTFSGHWLRCDIPQLEVDDDFVLYTDIDVVFIKDLPEVPFPNFVACGPEHWQTDYSYFNSGVMILNIPALRNMREELYSVVEKRLKITAPYDDQSALNELFVSRWDHLPPSWNWKPYWGRNDDALIIHFHGPKPAHARRMLAGDIDVFGNDFQTIFNRNPDGYRHYLQLVERLNASGA